MEVEQTEVGGQAGGHGEDTTSTVKASRSVRSERLEFGKLAASVPKLIYVMKEAIVVPLTKPSTTVNGVMPPSRGLVFMGRAAIAPGLRALEL